MITSREQMDEEWIYSRRRSAKALRYHDDIDEQNELDRWLSEGGADR